MLAVREKSGPVARAKLCNLRQEVVNNPLACQDSISSKFSNKCNLRQEVVNNPLACQDNTFRKFYYAIYGGWAFPKTPYLFQTPLEACCWCISRFKRDGLAAIVPGVGEMPANVSTGDTAVAGADTAVASADTTVAGAADDPTAQDSNTTNTGAETPIIAMTLPISSSMNFCGETWADALTKCAKRCECCL